MKLVTVNDGFSCLTNRHKASSANFLPTQYEIWHTHTHTPHIVNKTEGEQKVNARRPRQTYIIVLSFDGIFAPQWQPRIVAKYSRPQVVLIAQGDGVDATRHADGPDVPTVPVRAGQEADVAQDAGPLKVSDKVGVAWVVQQRRRHVDDVLNLLVLLEDLVERPFDGEVGHGVDGDGLLGPLGVGGDQCLCGGSVADGHDDLVVVPCRHQG